ncbi:MAG: dockerin type I repeat-containing protein [Clostridia bacterium]|nr:dockerin type I repeat-containing protein [Clostridia bacterium]
MKKTVSLLLTLLLVLFSLPLGASARISTGTVIDTDGSDGYSGDYVVVYNPSTPASNSLSTGNMTGLIETEVGSKAPRNEANSDTPYMIDVDLQLAELAASQDIDPKTLEPEPEKTSYNVGDTKTFMIMNYSPGSMFLQFKVLYKSEHAYVWTPTSTDPNMHPLDAIDPSYAQMAAEMFDSKFDLMQSSFGDHDNGSSGDGRLNLLYYNIDDGWQLGQGYIGGYFYALDLYTAGMPVLNIDTYPGVHYTNAAGVEISDISRTYSTIVHEYQHLICFSQCGAADTWINECMSAAAEEICFPGSSVYPRIQSWTDHYYSQEQDWFSPPEEVEYIPSFELENGYSMYDWSNDLPTDDLLVLYAQVSLFAQYMYTRFGNTVFHSIMDNMSNGGGLSAANSFQDICQAATGVAPSQLVEDFRVALTANTSPDEYGGIYSFALQPGYDPEEYYGVQNLYDLLCPVVFTGSSCAIKGGGAICIKPVGGVYYPPSGAASGLKYFGITRGSASILMGDVDLDGTVTSVDALLALRYAMGLVELTPEQIARGDLDGDGVVTSVDALEILRISLGISGRRIECIKE